MRNLVLQTYFADVSVETLGGVADCPFLCQYYSRNTDCLQPMAPHSQTMILDERWSIHCNSSCLYNRCGSTDVYVLYSRVHFYYLQIKDCVEEDHGFFQRSGLKLFTRSWPLETDYLECLPNHQWCLYGIYVVYINYGCNIYSCFSTNHYRLCFLHKSCRILQINKWILKVKYAFWVFISWVEDVFGLILTTD